MEKQLYEMQQELAQLLSQEEFREAAAGMSDAIWSYAELGYQEYNSAQLLANFLQKAGFSLQFAVAGMPTAFVAEFTNGAGPVIGLLAEMDALPALSQLAGSAEPCAGVQNGGEPAPGHGCTHNTMGVTAVLAAAALASLLARHKIGGSVRVFGCPAEESFGSRSHLVQAGLFADVDMVFDHHGGGFFGAVQGVVNSASFSFQARFHGRAAHAATTPWQGRSALDAVQMMNLATEHLREHMPPTARIHYAITEGGSSPNIVPQQATVWYMVREGDEGIKGLVERVLDCAKAAALATETAVEIQPHSAIHQCYYNRRMAQILQANLARTGYPAWTEQEQALARKIQSRMGVQEYGLGQNSDIAATVPPAPPFRGGGSSDVGELTLVVPVGKINIPTGIPFVPGHSWGICSIAGSGIAHKGIEKGATVLACSALELFLDETLRTEIREEFEQQKQRYAYNYRADGSFHSYLTDLQELSGVYRYERDSQCFRQTPGAAVKPDCDYFAAQMERHRKQMAQFYCTPAWYDGPPMKTQ